MLSCLDDPAQAGAVRADPDAVLRRAREPVLLDEWQEVPEVLGAVKRAVDADPHPGRFLLTGSLRAQLDQPMWPATGRVVSLRMYGLTEREVGGLTSTTGPSFIDKLSTADAAAIDLPAEVPDIAGYLEAGIDDILGDADLLGRFFDTFAMCQLRPEVALAKRPPYLSHLRDRNGRHEIDLLANFGRRGVVAVEFKAKSAPAAADAAHLYWLREQLGDKFLAGAVIHAGPSPYQLAERVVAVPLCAAWA